MTDNASGINTGGTSTGNNPCVPVDNSEVRAFAQFTLRMEVDLRRQLDAQAKSMGITPSEFVRNIIVSVIRNNGVWLTLPQSLIDKIDEGIAAGLFLDRNDAVMYYIRSGLESTPKGAIR